YEGTPPTPEMPPAMKTLEKDKDVCLHANAKEEEKVIPTWIVSKDKGVKNVVIFLKPPENKFFKIHESYLASAKQEKKELNQPHCAFIPHVLIWFPQYVDPKTKQLTATGQTLTVVNDAPINHNTKWPGRNHNLKPKQTEPVDNLDPDSDKATRFECSIH